MTSDSATPAAAGATPPGGPGLLTAGAYTAGLLTALSALGQFASNVYTPSLPAVAAGLGAPIGAVQLTLAVFLAGFALAQLVYGPLSDRFGRRRVLFAGLGLFALGTLGCALAPDMATLLGARLVQAFGAAAGIVIARAMIRDSFDGVALARVMALVTMAFALVLYALDLRGSPADE